MDTTHGSGTPLPTQDLHADHQAVVLTAAERTYVRDALLPYIETTLDIRPGEPIDAATLDRLRDDIALIDALGPTTAHDHKPLTGAGATRSLAALVADEYEWQTTDGDGPSSTLLALADKTGLTSNGGPA